jgi:hypothetical protein
VVIGAVSFDNLLLELLKLLERIRSICPEGMLDCICHWLENVAYSRDMRCVQYVSTGNVVCLDPAFAADPHAAVPSAIMLIVSHVHLL